MITIGPAGVSAAIASLGALLDGGSLRLYTGVRPASPSVPVPSAQILAEAKFSSKAWDSAKSGTIAANKIDLFKVRRTGEATWFRCVTRNGDAVLDGSVGVAVSDDLVLDRSFLQFGDYVSVSHLTLSLPLRRV